MAKVSATNAAREKIAQWYQPLPADYYDLTRRLWQLMRLLDDVTDPVVKAKAEAKQWDLVRQVQTIVDQALGPATCPTCAGVPLVEAVLLTREPQRVCVRHDLLTLWTVGGLYEPPGAGETPRSRHASTNSGR